MKKKIISLLLCTAMGLSIAACGGSSTESSSASSSSSTADTSAESEETEEETEEASTEGIVEYVYDGETPLLDSEDYTLEECISLGEYKGLSFTKTVEEVTEGQILLSISDQTGIEGEELTDADAEVQEGDTAVIEYVGTKDGVAFEGGTSTEPYGLQIGSGTFIDGFEDGIIGMKAGETKELNLTFPENYGSEELAGQDVVFTVTVNSIKRLVIDDAWVEENTEGEFEDAEAYLASFREVLEEENETTAQNALYSEIWDTVRENTEYIALPKVLVESAAAEYDESAAQMAQMYGYTLADMVEMYGEETYVEERAYYAEYDAKNTLLLHALMEAEDLDESSDEYAEELERLVESVGAESAEELIESYGQERIDEMVLQTIVIERIVTYSEITEE